MIPHLQMAQGLGRERSGIKAVRTVWAEDVSMADVIHGLSQIPI
jgi:hypothetical protein